MIHNSFLNLNAIKTTLNWTPAGPNGSQPTFANSSKTHYCKLINETNYFIIFYFKNHWTSQQSISGKIPTRLSYPHKTSRMTGFAGCQEDFILWVKTSHFTGKKTNSSSTSRPGPTRKHDILFYFLSLTIIENSIFKNHSIQCLGFGWLLCHWSS